MNYVCKWLSWWHNGVLVVGLKLEPSSLETDEYLLPATMALPVDFLIVPILVDVRSWIGLAKEDVFAQFMQKLTPLLSPLGTELAPMEPVSTALTYLVSAVQNWPSTLGSHLFSTVWTTE